MYPEDQRYDTIAPNDTMLNTQTDSTTDQAAGSAYHTSTNYLYSSPTSHQQHGHIAPTTYQHQEDQKLPAQASSSSTEPSQQTKKGPILCPFANCDRVFNRARDYNKHKKNHIKPVTCKADPTCTITKAEERDMNRHYEVSHKHYALEIGLNPENILCEPCGVTFGRRDNYLRHLRTKHDIVTAQPKGKK